MSLTSQIRYIRALDSAATDGSGKTGLIFSDFTAKYNIQGGTLTALTTENITTLGTYQAPTSAAHIRIKELNSANPTKGVYEVHFHDTQMASGVLLWLYLSASGAAIAPLEVDLVDVKTVVLAATGLDNIAITAPSGVASTFREMIVQLWRRFFKKATRDETTIKTYADNGVTVLTTQTISVDGDDEEQGAAT